MRVGNDELPLSPFRLSVDVSSLEAVLQRRKSIGSVMAAGVGLC